MGFWAACPLIVVSRQRRRSRSALPSQDSAIFTLEEAPPEPLIRVTYRSSPGLLLRSGRIMELRKCEILSEAPRSDSTSTPSRSLLPSFYAVERSFVFASQGCYRTHILLALVAAYCLAYPVAGSTLCASVLRLKT